MSKRSLANVKESPSKKKKVTPVEASEPSEEQKLKNTIVELEKLTTELKKSIELVKKRTEKMKKVIVEKKEEEEEEEIPTIHFFAWHMERDENQALHLCFYPKDVGQAHRVMNTFHLYKGRAIELRCGRKSKLSKFSSVPQIKCMEDLWLLFSECTWEANKIADEHEERHKEKRKAFEEIFGYDPRASRNADGELEDLTDEFGTTEVYEDLSYVIVLGNLEETGTLEWN
jgi:hypothetical protein